MYNMSRKEFLGLLQVARENVPFGIYAIEKNGYAELMNVHVMSRTKLKEHVRAYRSTLPAESFPTSDKS